MMPPSLSRFRALRRRSFRLLDVGCGNHSASITKRWYPHCEYFGIDRGVYCNDATDFGRMERFYDLDLETSELEEIPEGHFDVVICSHVIEHLRNGLDLTRRLCGKLRPGGQIYLEFPSWRSLALPSAPGSLHFCDDPSHVRVYTVPEVCNVVLSRGLAIRRAGRRRDWVRWALAPVARSLLRHGAVQGGALWDLCGFADFVWAYRPLALSPQPQYRPLSPDWGPGGHALDPASAGVSPAAGGAQPDDRPGHRVAGLAQGGQRDAR